MMTCNFSFSAFLLWFLLHAVLTTGESEAAVEGSDRAKVSTELAKAQQELETLRQQQELAKARQEIANLRQKLADTPKEFNSQTERVEPQLAPNAGGLRSATSTEVLRKKDQAESSDRTPILRSGQLSAPDADVPVSYREAAQRLRERREQQTTQRNNGEPSSLEKREQPLFPKDGKGTSPEERRRRHEEIIAKRREEMKRRQEMRQQHGGEGTVDMSQRLSPSLKDDPDLRGRIQERTGSRITELQRKRLQKRVPRRFEPKEAPVEPNEPPKEAPMSLETTPAKSLKPERAASDALLVTDDTILKTLENNWDLVLVVVLGFFVWYGPRLLDVSKKLCTRSKARHVL